MMTRMLGDIRSGADKSARTSPSFGSSEGKSFEQSLSGVARGAKEGNKSKFDSERSADRRPRPKDKMSADLEMAGLNYRGDANPRLTSAPSANADRPNRETDVASAKQVVDRRSSEKQTEKATRAESPKPVRVEVSNRPVAQAPSEHSNPEVRTEAAQSSSEELNQSEAGRLRRKAISEFLDQMQGEFGVSPDRILSAFGKMDEATLNASPEESTKKFLSQLEIPANQQARAAELYNSMVQTTGEAAFNEKIAGVESGVSMAVMSRREQAVQDLNKAVDQLNDVFALRSPSAASSETFMSDWVPLNGDLQGGAANSNSGADGLRAQMAAERMDAQLLRLMQAQGIKKSEGGPESVEQGASEEEIAALLGMEGLGEGLDASAAKKAGLDAVSTTDVSVNSTTVTVAGQTSTGKGFDSGNSSSKNSSADSGEEKTSVKKASTQSAGKGKDLGNFASSLTESSSAATDASAAAVSGTASASPKPAIAGPAGMILERPTPTTADEKENVKELIRQAQVALKNGGGEIKMDLKPEGIGQVKLKVSVENGQVNVQMLTDNDASKRLLEKGFHELKASLAAEQLKVENLQVDIGREIQKQMDQNTDNSREQARQFANDVMAQLRDERQGFRQGFMENRGWKQYPRNNPREDVQPADVGMRTMATRGAQMQSRSAANGRLNLVA